MANPPPTFHVLLDHGERWRWEVIDTLESCGEGEADDYYEAAEQAWSYVEERDRRVLVRYHHTFAAMLAANAEGRSPVTERWRAR